ncbi:MAG: holo-[acyl-carrier-protein] synthase, partial [Chloroflexi bacterium]|nr:holo-[acyl-carrier-protein] synthase [Chloroflexota bacterium]
MGTSTPAWRADVGVDIIEIGRIERVISEWQDSFLKRIYTQAELESHYNVSSLAARFAAKEAVMKALGTGARGVNWSEIEILTNVNGAPVIRLHGRALERSKEIGIAQFSVSMSHSRQYAVAFVIGHA